MTLQEAIKSGKRFHRPDADFLRAIRAERCMEQGKSLEDVDLSHLNLEDLLADDWEVEEETITITRSQLQNAFNYFHLNFHLDGPKSISQRSIDRFAQELGFKDLNKS